MKYVSWNKDKINEQLAILNRLYRHTLDEDILNDIELLQTAKSYELSPFQYDGTYRDQFMESVYAMEDNQPFLRDITMFSKLDAILQRKLIGLEDEYKISTKDLLEFIHDFYTKLDPELANIFLSIFRERRDNLKFTEDRGITFTVDKLSYSYIAISRNSVVADYVNAIHEYAHAIADRLYYRSNYNEGYPFIELMPLFMEFIACDKMMADFENVSRDVTGYKASELDNFIQYARSIDAMHKYLRRINYNEQLLPRHKREIIRDMMIKLRTGKEEVLTVLDVSALERISYLIPYMTAIELYYLYKLDPEKSLYTLKGLITMEEREDYYGELVSRDIFLNAHAKKLTLDINRDLKTFRD